MTHIGLPAGMRDFYGSSYSHRQYLQSVLQQVFRRNGFEPLETPLLEFAKTFCGHHGEGEELLFKTDGDELVLRYDHTVPLARLVAAHPELVMPFRRSTIGYSFRNEKLGAKGKLRQFIQADADIVGAAGELYDAEIISLAYEGLKALGFPDYVIRINHRGIISALAEAIGLPALTVQRALDNADKQELLGNAGLTMPILLEYGLDAGQAEELLRYCSALTLQELLPQLPQAYEAVMELQRILCFLPDEIKSKVRLDLRLARGADYYTGLILEGIIPQVTVGAVLGGGRFDDLLGKFNPEAQSPAVGMAFGFERLLIALEELDLYPDIADNNANVLCYSTTVRSLILDAATALRAQGINVITLAATEGDSKVLMAQVEHINPAVIIRVDGRTFNKEGEIKDEALYHKVLEVLHRLC